MLVDYYLVYSFIKRLVTPFDQWYAYKLGIIDEKGNQLKLRKDFKTVEERDAFQLFDLLVLKLKKILMTMPAGQTKLATYAAALWLIKEKLYQKEETHEVDVNEFIAFYENFVVNYLANQLAEDIAVNNTGNVAGIGNPTNSPEPGVKKKKRNDLILATIRRTTPHQ